MKSRFDRRELLRRGGPLAAGALGGGPFVAAPARAIEPIDREGLGPSFKLSLAAYGYRRLLLARSPVTTLFDFMDDCARLGLDGTELTSYYFPQPTTRGS